MLFDPQLLDSNEQEENYVHFTFSEKVEYMATTQLYNYIKNQLN